ncbi:MAG: DUF4185 domain-containing protein [Gemmatimonadales bacterium]|nr:MAG: DUF4185 domain-containing protein [Gemmatimonadales bacterium]
MRVMEGFPRTAMGSRWRAGRPFPCGGGRFRGALGVLPAALILGSVVSCLSPLESEADRRALAPATSNASGLQVGGVELLSPITGIHSLADTRQWDIFGTDLGHMFWHGDQMYMVFGDTFGRNGFGGDNWRSNTMARISTPGAGDRQLRIQGMITGPDGKAKELIPSLKKRGREVTVIPTHGISVDGRMHLHYMSVSRWHGETGRWDVRHSGIAYSDDDGQTWAAPQGSVRPGDLGFEQVALVRSGDHVYTFGIPQGRFGGVRLGRVIPSRILEYDAYEYWNGDSWGPELRQAREIVPPAVGELSVAWNEHHRVWLMMYLNLERGAVVLRTAPELVGPWGAEKVVLTAEQFPGLYAPYIVPMEHLGEEVLFSLSLWGPYNVFLMRMDLTDPPAPAPGPLRHPVR